MSEKAVNARLKAYESFAEASAAPVERLFAPILVLTVSASMALGFFFTTIETPNPVTQRKRVRMVQTTFIMPTEKKPPPPAPPRKPEEKRTDTRKPEKPVDLTDKPKMAQRADTKAEKPEASKKKVRRVYGLKKVYSRGIGAGGSMEDAVIGKLGNTIDKEFDTLSATKEEIQGTVVSTTTVEAPPQFIRQPRPAYSQEMLEHQVEGTVRVKVLVDIDGTVKRAVALNDLGFDSATRASQACLSARFTPAMRSGEPVAVWIIVPIRFEILG